MARSERFRHPGLVIGGSFTAAIAAGTLLLWLPVAAASGQRTGFVDAIFTATSAVCVTGLVTVDTATHWSTFGQLVILGLIQIGGLAVAGLESAEGLTHLIATDMQTRRTGKPGFRVPDVFSLHASSPPASYGAGQSRLSLIRPAENS